MSESTASGDKSPKKASPAKDKAKDSGSGETAASKTSDSGAKTPEAGAKKSESSGTTEKSAKESIGGAKDIHYGFFSSVRTPEYRSGWDDIWGKSNGAGSDRAKRAATKPTAKSGSTAKSGPRTVDLKIDDLPDDIRDGLVEAARKKMRRSRASYDKLDASGAVDWTISVTVHGGR